MTTGTLAEAPAGSNNGVHAGEGSKSSKAFLNEALAAAEKRDPGQPEFMQAVHEVLASLGPVLEANPAYLQIIPRLLEPERAIIFRVPWTDDAGRERVNRGFRVQFSSALGPFKGGLRFHPSVNLSVIKFLGFEQIFKNALTTLPMGGGKGGSDFDPRGKSDAEVMRFCQSFMTELHRHIGPQTDVPAGDIGVGGREIGFLFGQWKRLSNEFAGVLTGKAPAWGGSLMRPEATGYGAVYFGGHILKANGDGYEGKRVLVSGAGNVATYAALKVIELGGVVLTLSDSTGTVVEDCGFTKEQVEQVMDLKTRVRTTLADYKSPTGVYHKGVAVWALDIPADIAMPCATQNEIDGASAAALAKAGVKLVLEGANMPTTAEGVAAYEAAGVQLAPAKACNAGGVAVSGLEMAQNAGITRWSAEEVDARLQGIMESIYNASAAAAKKYGTSFVNGANIAGFVQVADAMLAQGCV